MKISDILLESFSDAKRIFSQTEDKQTVSKYLDTFKDLAKRNIIKGQEKDISFWIKQGWESFKQLVDDNKEVHTNSEVKKSKKKDSVVVHEDEEKMVVIPLTKDASIYYGKNTKWCTSATKSENKFEEYFSKGIVLFYVLLKTGDKYAAAYANTKNHTSFTYFDEEDTEIDYDQFVSRTTVSTTMMTQWAEQNSSLIEKSLQEQPERIKRDILQSNDPDAVVDYVGNTGQPFPEGEAILATDIEASVWYARNILKGPFPRGEDIISQSATASTEYARDVIKGPFPKGEDAISQDRSQSLEYAASAIKGRFPKGEDIIATDAKTSYWYARKALKGPFPKGEDVIATDDFISRIYAEKVLNGPFPKGENAIAIDGVSSFEYSVDVLKGPFPKGEEAISTNANQATKYYGFLKNNGFEKESHAFKTKYMKG